jgi:pSer/pThr/pTyr-binding forkhead associated (FHA) protein
MPALFLNLLKLIFLALVYLFLWQVARSIGRHVGAPQAARSSKRAEEMVVVRSDTIAGRRFTLGPPAVLGRSEEADIVIDDPYASDFHVRVGVQDGTVLANDLGSTNGTYVNGRRVTVPTPLIQGDSLQIGKTILEVR